MKKLTGYISQTHYGNSMNPAYMAKWGRNIAVCVSDLIDSGKFPILIYRGMSGTTAATAIAMHIKKYYEFGMVYVRKNNEKSHGQKVETTMMDTANREIVWILCDDFITSGKTALETIKEVSKHFDIDIDLDKLLFALSLDEDVEEIANQLNTLESAVSFRNSGAATIADLRAQHAIFVNYQQQERKERAERMAIASQQFLKSLEKILNNQMGE